MFEFLRKKNRYGLALGAGGAKGFIHIGVIKALNNLNIEITHIAGSSVGALIGGMYALWGDIKKIEDIVLNYDKKKLVNLFRSDIGLSKGVFRGDAVLEELNQYLSDAQIENCHIPFVAVAVDISTGEKIYLNKGSLKDAIRASGSVPLVFKPYEINGRHFVDGGLAENVPVMAAKSIGAKKILAVNIQGFPMNDEKLNTRTLIQRSYRASIYHLAKNDVKYANKALSFNIEDIEPSDLIDNPERLIQMGYDEAKKLFGK